MASSESVHTTNNDDEEQNGGPPDDTIFDLIQEGNWEAVSTTITTTPKTASLIDSVSGQAPLHKICSIGSCSEELIQMVVEAAPTMIRLADKVYHDTPLHIVCRNSQTTSGKIRILLRYATPEDVLKRNVIGGTCLHSACGHNAILDVLEQIVRKNPAVLKISTFDQIPPIRGLFFSYTQSIPGVLAVGRLLKRGRQEKVDNEEGHWERFWAKASFLALEYHKLTTAYPTPPATITQDHVAHGLIHSSAPLNLLKIAFKLNANCARAVDRHGNTPLHLLVERRPYRLKEREALQSALQAFPEAAGISNRDGHPPLLLAIKNKIPFENGVCDILKSDMTVVSCQDTETHLVPFQLAAAVGGPEALNTTFSLLSALPQELTR
jgi:ankyrin repeat protein